jgi:hypothetical protein
MAPMMNTDDMVCICIKAPPVMSNQMAANSQNCNCTCNMDYMENNMDISAIDHNRTYNANKSNRSRRGNKKTLQELEETMANMQDYFEQTILQVEDDPSNAVPLGRYYRVNSFR